MPCHAVSTEYGFCGNVVIEGSVCNKKPCHDAAHEAIVRRSEPSSKGIHLVAFCHSNFDPTVRYVDSPGGYSVVFNRIYATDPADVGKEVKMGWHINPAIRNDLTDGLAIAQAIRTMREEICARRDAMQANGNNEDAIFGEITIQIFFPDVKTLRAIRETRDTLIDRDRSPWDKVLGAVTDESQALKDAGLKTTLELRWLPGRQHTIEPLHRAREIAEWVRKKCKNFYRVGDFKHNGPRAELDVSTSVFSEFQPYFLQIHKLVKEQAVKQRAARKAKKASKKNRRRQMKENERKRAQEARV